MSDSYDCARILNSQDGVIVPQVNEDDRSFFNVIFTAEEMRYFLGVLDVLKFLDMEVYKNTIDKCDGLNQLLINIGRYPSLFNKNGERNYYTLVSFLVDAEPGDKLLSIPTKAFLGKGFLVAKFQMFSGIYNYLQDNAKDFPNLSRMRSLTLRVMFTMMLEDVYFSILEDKENTVELRTKVAKNLIFLWEHRCDMNAEILPKMLEKVWAIRDSIVPAFGTMVGTSELLRLMIEMPGSWLDFIKKSEQDVNIKAALEEFIFGLTYEQIAIVRKKMDQMVTKAIGREEVCRELHQEDLAFENELSPKKFYKMFSIRRDSARGRREFKLEGPTHTLEDYFMRFLLENDRSLLS